MNYNSSKIIRSLISSSKKHLSKSYHSTGLSIRWNKIISTSHLINFWIYVPTYSSYFLLNFQAGETNIPFKGWISRIEFYSNYVFPWPENESPKTPGYQNSIKKKRLKTFPCSLILHLNRFINSTMEPKGNYVRWCSNHKSRWGLLGCLLFNLFNGTSRRPLNWFHRNTNKNFKRDRERISPPKIPRRL